MNTWLKAPTHPRVMHVCNARSVASFVRYAVNLQSIEMYAHGCALSHSIYIVDVPSACVYRPMSDCQDED